MINTLVKVFFFTMVLCLFQHLPAEVPHARFFVVTPEKTGTHLLTKALSKMLDQECINNWNHEMSQEELTTLLRSAESQNCFVQMHALPTDTIIKTLKRCGYRVVFLMRDPRDQAVSLFRYIANGWSYGPYRMNGAYGKLSLDDQLDEIITGRRYGQSATLSIIGRRLPWMAESPRFVYTAFFENLVGAEGGGSREAQLAELRGIAKFLKAPLSKKEIAIRSLGLFGKPGEGTFRSGQIGTWKKYFNASHIEGMKEVFGDEIIFLGYEKDDNW